MKCFDIVSTNLCTAFCSHVVSLILVLINFLSSSLREFFHHPLNTPINSASKNYFMIFIFSGICSCCHEHFMKNIHDFMF